jgi:O-acetyl-ADP-ribose deacetylase (regulator of RNase III)
MLVVPTGFVTNPRYIINFPTKRHWRERSRLEDIESGLRALVGEIQRLGIGSIAIPPLGCGNGGLDWSDVEPRIVLALQDVPEVRVLLYRPHGAPRGADPRDRRDHRSALSLTDRRSEA